MTDTTALRAEYRSAVDQMHALAHEIETWTGSATSAEFKDLQKRFDRATDTANSLNDKIELSRVTREARAIAIPDTEIGDFGRTRRGPQLNRLSEPLVYRPDQQEVSFFRDLRDAQSGNVNARTRLDAHQRQAQEAYNLSSTDAAGGYLVAPLYLQDEFVNYARAGRVITDALGVRPLPPSTDSISLPTMDGGTAVADQADGGAVQETDATFNQVTAAVKTIAGMQDVSRQIVDRGVPGTDEVIFGDLAGAYNALLDTAVINSSVTNNKGLLQVSGINSVTYTDASPTLAELWPKISDAIQRIATGIYAPATAIFMHPRRWAWCLAALDTTTRPLIVPVAGAVQAVNPAAAVGTEPTAEGAVGLLQGLPVYTDANIPITNGSGTNEDVIIVVRREECFVWEDAAGPYLETFGDVGSGTLEIRFRAHSYWAQAHSRRALGISKISGTGLAAPSW